MRCIVVTWAISVLVEQALTTVSKGLLGERLTIADGRLVTRLAASAGDVLLHLPRELVLSKDSAQDSPFLLSYLDPADGASAIGLPHWSALPDDFILALQIAMAAGEEAHAPAAKQLDGSARWRSWLELALTQLNGTMRWNDEERTWLEGSQVLPLEAEMAQRIEWQLETLMGALAKHDPATFIDGYGGRFSAASMRELLEVVHTHMLHPTESGRPILLPLPLLHVEESGSAALRLIRSSGDVQLVSTRTLEVGTEVTLDGSGHEHASLMVRQGTSGTDARACIVEHATGLGSIHLTLSLPEGDALYELKAVLLGKLSMQATGERFQLNGGRAAPERLLGFARLMVLQEYELPLLPLNELPLRPLAPANEDHAFRLIATSAEALLAAYGSTIEEDEYALATASDDTLRSRRGAALTAVLLEKRILSSLVATTHEALHAYLRSLPNLLPHAGSSKSGPDEAVPRGVRQTVQPHSLPPSSKDEIASSTASRPRVHRSEGKEGARARDRNSSRRARKASSDGRRARSTRVGMAAAYVPIGVELVRERASKIDTNEPLCNAIIARSVVQNGSAAHAGVQVGMALESVSGSPAASLTVGDIRMRLLAATYEQPVHLLFVDRELFACDTRNATSLQSPPPAGD